MPAIRFPSLEELRDGLRCPKCGYSLRGHDQDDVSCPECGTTSDLQSAVLAGWRNRWNRTPWFRQLMLPAVLFAVGAVAAIVAWLGALVESGAMATSGAAVAVATGTTWTVSLVQVFRAMAGARMVGALILLHVIYLAAAIAVSVLPVAAYVVVLLGVAGLLPTIPPLAVGALAMVGAVVALHGCRRAERRLARRMAGRLLCEWLERDRMAA